MMVIGHGLQLSNQFRFPQSSPSRATVGLKDQHFHITVAYVLLPPATSFGSQRSRVGA